jgi:hypothetical protein
MNHDLGGMAQRRRDAHAALMARDFAVHRAFLDMEQAAFAEGVLPRKPKELIAIGISVVNQLRVVHAVAHRAAALAGASEREGIRGDRGRHGDGRGPATADARFALEVMGSVFTADEAPA